MFSQNERIIQVNVDPQNDFCPGGSLAVNEGDQIMAPLSALADRVRKIGGSVIHTRDWHPARTNHFAQYGGVWPDHCVANTYGAQFHQDVQVGSTDLVISKGTEEDQDAYSGFQGLTDQGRSLADIIKASTLDTTLLIGGLATDYCVKTTVLDALALKTGLELRAQKLSVVVLTDLVRAVNIGKDDGRNALAEMRAAGALAKTSKQILKELAQ